MPKPPAHAVATSRDPERRPVGALRLTDRVPYIAAWSGESAVQPEVTVRRGRLAYLNEQPWDRDSDGVLWRRIPSLPSRGVPQYGKVHFLRQRQAMLALLCQVCGRPAGRDSTGDGLLWLLGEDPADPASWPQELVTGHPPVCLSCAWEAVRVCPHLQRQYAAVRVRRVGRSGLHGVLYRPSYPAPVPYDVGTLEFGDDRMYWMQAAQLMMSLEEYRLVDLEAEYRARGGSGAGER